MPVSSGHTMAGYKKRPSLSWLGDTDSERSISDWRSEQRER